jgi:hypothetical protein
MIQYARRFGIPLPWDLNCVRGIKRMNAAPMPSTAALTVIDRHRPTTSASAFCYFSPTGTMTLPAAPQTGEFGNAFDRILQMIQRYSVLN